MTLQSEESDITLDFPAQRRRDLLVFLRSDRPAWRNEDHPELAAGSAAWVRNLRRESEDRD